MDKDTIVQYGWIVIVSLVIAVLIGIATPFGELVGDGVVMLAKGQSDFLDKAYSDESIKEQTDYMNKLFDATYLLEPGLYMHNNSTVCAMNWDELIKNDYIRKGTGIIRSGSKTTKLNGDLIIDDLVTTIWTDTFKECKDLQLVRLGIGTLNIHPRAFQSCENLETFISNENLKIVNTSAFNNCSKLKNVQLGNRVTNIKEGAFQGCSSLQTITYCGTVEEWNAITKSSNWCDNTLKTIVCTNGIVNL